MKKSLFIILLFSVLLFACKNNSKTENQDQPQVAKQDANSQVDTKGSEKTFHVSLNNGQKWTANPETTEEIRYMKKVLESFTANPTLQDYQTLKSQMVAEYGLIVQRATMPDDAKAQLMNYLTPLRKTMDKLSITDLDICRKAVAELKEQLDQYDNYFI